MEQSVFPQSNALIAYPTGDDIVILNGEGVCVASSDNKKISKSFKSDIEGRTLKKIRLNLDGKTILFTWKGKDYAKKELNLIKNLAKVTLEHYISSVSKPLGSVDQFIAEIIEQPLTPDRIKRFEKASGSFGFNLEVPRVAILVEINDFTENLASSISSNLEREDIIQNWKQNIIQTISGFFTVKTDIIPAYLGDGRFVFFKEIAGDVNRFIKHMKSAYLAIFAPLIDDKKNNLNVGFSNAYYGINGLYDAYFEALQALQLGPKFSSGRKQSFWYGDLGTLRILTEENKAKKVSYAKEILKPLEKETLKQTLEMFLNENMDIKQTASKLRVHPNTVNYRLSRIAESLNLDPRIFKQAFELRIAIITDKIFA